MAGSYAFFASDNGSLRRSRMFSDMMMGEWWFRSGKRGDFGRFDGAVSEVVSESVAIHANVWMSPITVFVSFSWANSSRDGFGNGIDIDGVSR